MAMAKTKRRRSAAVVEVQPSWRLLRDLYLKKWSVK